MTLDGGKLPMQMDRVDEILNSAEIGIYRIIMRKGEHPRLQGSAKLRELLGVDKDYSFTEEEFYDYWYSHIAPADVLSRVRRLRIFSIMIILIAHTAGTTLRWVCAMHVVAVWYR